MSCQITGLFQLIRVFLLLLYFGYHCTRIVLTIRIVTSKPQMTMPRSRAIEKREMPIPALRAICLKTLWNTKHSLQFHLALNKKKNRERRQRDKDKRHLTRHRNATGILCSHRNNAGIKTIFNVLNVIKHGENKGVHQINLKEKILSFLFKYLFLMRLGL